MVIIGVLVLIAVTVAAILVKLRVSRSHTPHLGWMSEQWLAQHRASHPM